MLFLIIVVAFLVFCAMLFLIIVVAFLVLGLPLNLGVPLDLYAQRGVPERGFPRGAPTLDHSMIL